MMAGRMGRPGGANDAVVHATVHLGEPEEMKGFGIAVDISVEGVDEELLQAGHDVRVCFFFFLQVLRFPSNNINIVIGFFFSELPVQSGTEAWRGGECFQGLM